MTFKELLNKSLENAFKEAGKCDTAAERAAAYNAVAANCIKALSLEPVAATEPEGPKAKPAPAKTATATTKTTAKTTAATTKTVEESKPAATAPTKAEPAKATEEPKPVTEPAAEPAASAEAPVLNAEGKVIDPNTFTEEWTDDAFVYFANEVEYIQEVANQFVASGNRDALVTMLKAATDGQVTESDGITPLNVRLIYDYLSAQVAAKQG